MTGKFLYLGLHFVFSTLIPTKAETLYSSYKVNCLFEMYFVYAELMFF